MLKNKKIWGLVLGLLILIAVLSIGWFYFESQPGLSVKSYRVESSTVQDYIEDTAEYASRRIQSLQSEITGMLLERPVAIGDYVKEGQLIAKLNVDYLDFQRQGLLARKMGLEAYLAELSKPVSSNLKAKMSASLESSQLALDHLEKQLRIQKSLMAQGGSVTQVVIEDLENALAVAQANHKAMESDAKLAQEGASKYVIDQGKADLLALDSEIASLNAQIEKATLRATIDGVIVSLNFKEGEMVQSGSPVAQIEEVALAATYFKAELLADDVKHLKVGNKVLINLESDQAIEGLVRRIYPKAHTKISDLGVEQKRVFVEIDIDQGVLDKTHVDHVLQSLKLGYIYDIKVIHAEQAGISIPKSAMFKISGEPNVFQIIDDKAVLKAVTVIFEGVEALVIEGLSEGDVIVQSPGTQIEVGMKVKDGQ